ncbi:hypothetical protein [Streptomyces sp. NPDC055709]
MDRFAAIRSCLLFLRNLMLPHLSYADAIHAALVSAGLVPETLIANAPDPYVSCELSIVFSWEDITLRWSSDTGWRHEAPHCGGPLPLNLFAAPAAVVAAVALLADGHPPVTCRERWDDAASFAVALGDWEQSLSSSSSVGMRLSATVHTQAQSSPVGELPASA